MKITHMVKELESIAVQLGRKVRYETGSFRGGHCVVTGDDCIVLNRRHTPEIHFSVLANSLKDLPLDNVFLRPAIRSALQEAWEARETELQSTDDE